MNLIEYFPHILEIHWEFHQYHKPFPEDWHKGIIKPIHKGGSMYDLDNNRGITLTSNVYKVYAKIIEQSVMSYMEDNGILGEMQGAFRRKDETKKRIGDRTHPCFSPSSWSNQSDSKSPKRTLLLTLL
jgi:hypothetical protein